MNEVKSGVSIDSSRSIFKDLNASFVVFLLALPLCLGIALASDAPLYSGLLAGVLGGIVVGFLSGSQVGVSGPAAGLTAIVAMQIAVLGSFEAFLLSVLIAGLMQIGLGLARAGSLSSFFPSSVVNGLLAAIGVILILKQIPLLLGHHFDTSGEMGFQHQDADSNTVSLIADLINGGWHKGAALIGICSIVLMVAWRRSGLSKKTRVSAPLVVVVVGVLLQYLLSIVGGSWAIETVHLVNIPVAETFGDLGEFLTFPDFSRWSDSAIYLSAATIALVASLESLINLEAVDNLDVERRDSPPSRELVAQGIGNTFAGLLGAIPMTLVVVRSSANVDSGAKTKLATILHGVLLLVSVVFLPTYLNYIPLAALAGILFVIGFSLASAAIFKKMWREGRYQFVPFMFTVVAIVCTDLLTGILIGLGISVLFILHSNLRTPLRRVVETHLAGDVLHIELASQVSFFNRASLNQVFNEADAGSDILIDASDTEYIDSDVLALIRDFKNTRGPARGVSVSLRGFREKYDLEDEIQFADYSSRELQGLIEPEQVLEILRAGNLRFQLGKGLTRDFSRQVDATAGGQTPLAAILSCIDSRVPTELVFDLGIGDIFSVRVAGNVSGSKSIGSIEYAVGVAGVKLVLVLGHTRCGAVTAAVKLLGDNKNVEEETGCQYLHTIVDEVAPCIEQDEFAKFKAMDAFEKEGFVDAIARRNVLRSVSEIIRQSRVIREATESGKLLVVGAVYDVKSGNITFLSDDEKLLAAKV